MQTTAPCSQPARTSTSYAASLREQAGEAVTSAGAAIEQTGLTRWSGGELARTFVQTRAGHEVVGYPALVDEGATVAIRVLSTPEAQRLAMRQGTRRLLTLTVPVPTAVVRDLDNEQKLALALNPHGGIGALVEDCFAAAVDVVVADAGGPAWDPAAFDRLAAAVAERASGLVRDLLALARRVLVDGATVDRRLTGRAELALLPALADMKAQWGRLMQPGFVAEAGSRWLARYPTYFGAMGRRLDRLAEDPHRDAVLMGQVRDLEQAYLHRRDDLAPGVPATESLTDVRWMLEELRVSLWAQQLGTAGPVSPQRVQRALAEL